MNFYTQIGAFGEIHPTVQGAKRLQLFSTVIGSWMCKLSKTVGIIGGTRRQKFVGPYLELVDNSVKSLSNF